jgi:hypothetical protein
MCIARCGSRATRSAVAVLLAIAALSAVGGCARQSEEGALVPAPDPQRLEAHVRALAGLAEPRCFRYPAGLESAAVYVERELTCLGYVVERQVYTVEGRPVRNLIARVGAGRGPLVVIGAHYDVCDSQPGADDNASAVAGLLEIARALKQNEARLRNEVEIVFYTLEEPPFFATPQMGSFVHATSLNERGVVPRLMICLDMIGYFTTERIQSYPLELLKFFFPRDGNFILVVSDFKTWRDAASLCATFNRWTTLACRFGAAPASIQGVDFSDHRNYWKYGVRALLITDTAFLRNKNYHSTGDTPETLDYGKMAEASRAVSLYVLAGIR